MTDPASRPWDYFPLVAGAITVATAVGYVELIRSQGNDPLWWVLGALGLAALVVFYGSIRRARLRVASLSIGGGVLLVLGMIGIFSIGLPLLAAAGLTWSSVFLQNAHRNPQPPW